MGTDPGPRALGPAPRVLGPAPQTYGRPSRTHWPSTSRGRGARGGTRTGLRDPTSTCSRTPRDGQVDSDRQAHRQTFLFLCPFINSIQKSFITMNNYRMENCRTLSLCSPRNLQSVLRLQPPVPPGVLPRLDPPPWGGVAGLPSDPWSSEKHERPETPVLWVNHLDPTPLLCSALYGLVLRGTDPPVIRSPVGFPLTPTCSLVNQREQTTGRHRIKPCIPLRTTSLRSAVHSVF